MLDTRFPVSLHILASLAHAEGTRLNSEVLAQGMRTNPVVVRRLVSKLVAAGIVKSYKGKTGGIELAKDPKNILLSEIYSATEHRHSFSDPGKKPIKDCPVSCSMAKIFGKLFAGAERAQMKYLAGITLAEVLKQIQCE